MPFRERTASRQRRGTFTTVRVHSLPPSLPPSLPFAAPPGVSRTVRVRAAMAPDGVMLIKAVRCCCGVFGPGMAVDVLIGSSSKKLLEVGS